MSISSTDAFWNALSAYDTGSALASNEGAATGAAATTSATNPSATRQLERRLGSGDGGDAAVAPLGTGLVGRPFIRQHPDVTGAERAVIQRSRRSDLGRQPEHPRHTALGLHVSTLPPCNGAGCTTVL